MKYFFCIIICLAAFACANHKEVEKMHNPSPFFRFFNIYETPDYENKISKISKEIRRQRQQRTRPHAEIKIDKEQLRQCFEETFNDKRANLLLENGLNITYVELLVSDEGKIMGMRIRTPKESDITDKEIKTLSRNLYNIKVHNINDYPVTASVRFTFSTDYFLFSEH